MSRLPASLEEPILDTLRTIGDATPVRAVRGVGGGCINNASRLETDQSAYMLKWNARPLPRMFEVEARGLELLRTSGAVRVPTVFRFSEATDRTPAFVLMEWLEPATGGRASQETLGVQLAALHHSTAEAYGLDHDNYIGSTPQNNGWDADWISFFRERRLRPQIELAQRIGRLHPGRRRMLERLLEHLDALLGGLRRSPSLIHGDLWGGNIMAIAAGGYALIDPAVSYSDREAELAFTEMFGGFTTRFYQAYQEAWPLEPGYTDRRDLYNLYHLLNHLNLFGEGYGTEVDTVARRYAG